MQKSFAISQRGLDLALLLLLGLVAALPRLVLQHQAPIFAFTDSVEYLEPAYNLANGQGFTNSLKRPAGYPLLLAAALAGSGEQLRAITALQHLLGLAAVGLTYLLGRTCFNRWVGFGAALLVALSGPQLTYEHTPMSEAAFTPLLVALALALIGLTQSSGRRSAALAGLLIGLSALIRPVGTTLLLPGLAAVALRPGGVRQRLLAAVVMLAAFCVVTTPWMARNLLTYGRFTVGGSPGDSLLARTLAHERGEFVFDGPGVPAEPDPARGRARQIVQAGVDSGARPSQVAAQIRAELALDEVETDRLIQQLCLEAIARQPRTFLLGLPEFFLELYLKDERPLDLLWESWRVWETHATLGPLVDPPPLAAADPSPSEAALSLYRPGRHGLVLLLAALFGLLVTWRLRPLAPTIVPAGLWLFLVMIHLVLDGPVVRYRAPAEPLLSVLAVGGATLGLLALGRSSLAQFERLTDGPAARRRALKPVVLPALGLFVFVAALRIWAVDQFDPTPFGKEYDEGIRLEQLALMAAGFRPFHDIYASQGPLLLDFTYPFFEAFGRQVVGARAPVVLGALVCLITIFLIACRLGGWLSGLAALTLLGLSLDFLRLSRVALAEVLSLAPACLALWLVLLYRDNRRRPLLVGSALCYALAILLKPMAFTVLAAIAPALLLAVDHTLLRSRLKAVLLWGLIVGLVCAVVLLLIGPGVLAEVFVAYRQGASGLGALGRGQWSLGSNWATIRSELGLDLIVVGLALASTWPLARAARLYAIVASTWLAATLLLLLVYSPLAGKHTAYLMPPAALLAGGGIGVALRRLALSRPNRLEPALIPTVLMLSLYLLSLQPLLRADWRVASGIGRGIDPPGDVQDALALISAVTAPGDYLLTDHPYLAYLADRPVPPRLADPSRTRILAGALDDAEAVEQTQAFSPRVVIFWANRLQLLWQYTAWLESGYSLARMYDYDRAVYVRNDAAAALSERTIPPAGFEARFGEVLELAALETETLDSKRGQRLALTWRALRPIPAEFYVVHLELQAPDGQAVYRRHDPLLPIWRQRPWPASQPLVQRRWLPLDGIEPGEYSLILRLTLGPVGPALPATRADQPSVSPGLSPGDLELARVIVTR